MCLPFCNSWAASLQSTPGSCSCTHRRSFYGSPHPGSCRTLTKENKCRCPEMRLQSPGRWSWLSWASWKSWWAHMCVCEMSNDWSSGNIERRRLVKLAPGAVCQVSGLGDAADCALRISQRGRAQLHYFSWLKLWAGPAMRILRGEFKCISDKSVWR